MVATWVGAVLIGAMRRRAGIGAVALFAPTRLVGGPRLVDHVAYVADRTSALVLRPGAKVQVLPAGSLVLPALVGRTGPTYAVVTHEPVEVWLRIGPFDTSDERTLQQVELRLTIVLSSSAPSLRDLVAESGGPGPDGLDGLEEALLDRLTGEVAARTTEAVHRWTLAELTGLSLGVLLDGALPATFLGGLVERSALEVVDVDWPTEGRGWSADLAPATGVTGPALSPATAPGPAPAPAAGAP